MDADPFSKKTSSADPAIKSTYGDPWRIFLIELIHLLGLFFTHSRYAERAQANAVLFDQFVGRLNILDKMPGHEGGMIIRRVGHILERPMEKPDYFFLFGNEAFRGSDALARNGHIHKGAHHLTGALDQAFGCLQEQGIFALYIQLPGKSSERIDQLRLALNIVARFRQAVENNASITFRYFGRAMAIPLIRDSKGKPDPNLTLVAGLNGLSAVNMREIIKQAVSFCRLSKPPAEEECSSENYNKIFSVRSLRSQLIQPLVEVNNLPWMKIEDFPLRMAPGDDQVSKDQNRATGLLEGDKNNATNDPNTMTNTVPSISESSPFDPSAVDLNMHMEASDKKALDAMGTLFDFNHHTLSAEILGKHLGMITRLLHGVGAETSDSASTEHLLNILHHRIEQLPEDVLAQMEVRRQGLKIEIQGRKILVGMVHPKVLDLMSLVKERIETQRKSAVIRDQAYDFLHSGLRLSAEHFGVSDSDAAEISELLKACFNEMGRFRRGYFISHIDELSRYENTIFEILWCLLKHTAQAEDRLAILNALPLLAERMGDPKQALSFLLADLFSKPRQVEISDRNAFALATLMLRTHNKEKNIDINSTPEEVLAVRKSLNNHIVRHVAWRMDIDRAHILSKFMRIRNALHSSLATPSSQAVSNADAGYRFLLALEREGIIFIALAGGTTAGMILRSALAYYGDPGADIYQYRLGPEYLFDLMAQLQIVLRGMARLGQPQDLDSLKALEQSASRLMGLDTEPAYAQRVKQTLQWVEPAIRAIQVRLH